MIFHAHRRMVNTAQTTLSSPSNPQAADLHARRTTTLASHYRVRRPVIHFARSRPTWFPRTSTRASATSAAASTPSATWTPARRPTPTSRHFGLGSSAPPSLAPSPLAAASRPAWARSTSSTSPRVPATRMTPPAPSRRSSTSATTGNSDQGRPFGQSRHSASLQNKPACTELLLSPRPNFRPINEAMCLSQCGAQWRTHS
mmetsp:Transcript_3631/g.10713  ORF Transcript_3631/g.10713 Transcript_3631/m.10713 type:complete len:201 (+) Transcript_3631:1262-1864(+)